MPVIRSFEHSCPPAPLCASFPHGINSMMSAAKPAFVFVHGAWHNSGSWQFVAPALQSHGYRARTLDLPGAGKYAEPPQSYLRRPLQIEKFTREHSRSRSGGDADAGASGALFGGRGKLL